jgi:hypothetical protein
MMVKEMVKERPLIENAAIAAAFADGAGDLIAVASGICGSPVVAVAAVAG